MSLNSKSFVEELEAALLASLRGIKALQIQEVLHSTPYHGPVSVTFRAITREGYYFECTFPRGFKWPQAKTGTACECGAEKAGSPGHSNWCPAHKA